MIYILLSILSGSCNFINFKLFDKFKIDNSQAITVNYITASLCGFVNYLYFSTCKPEYLPHQKLNFTTLFQVDWIWGTTLLGVMFITFFTLMAITAQKNGISVCSIANNLSTVLPVLYGIWYLGETFDIVSLKTFGVLAGFISLVCIAYKGDFAIKDSQWYYVLPVLVFIGSGVVDILINQFRDWYMHKCDATIFSACIFGTAACVGILNVAYLVFFKGVSLKFKNVLGGISLGVPNYFSIVFLVEALAKSGLDSSLVYLFVNVSVLLVTTLLSVTFFKEKMLVVNWVGVLLAMACLICVA